MVHSTQYSPCAVEIKRSATGQIILDFLILFTPFCATSVQPGSTGFENFPVFSGMEAPMISLSGLCACGHDHQAFQEISDRVQAKLVEYGWSPEVLMAIGIGSVKSYDDYLHRMTQQYGHKASFLQEVDLDRKGIFNENNLIYTIKNEFGSPVAFTARDLLYEEKAEKYRSEREAIEQRYAGDEKKIKQEIDRLFRPRKYNNSAGENEGRETQVKNRIFKKVRFCSTSIWPRKLFRPCGSSKARRIARLFMPTGCATSWLSVRLLLPKRCWSCC